MRWIFWEERRMGSEENEDDLERIGKDRKIGITQFELVTDCYRLSCFPPPTPLLAIRSTEFEKRCTIFANYSALPCVTLGGCPRFELFGNSG